MKTQRNRGVISFARSMSFSGRSSNSKNGRGTIAGEAAGEETADSSLQLGARCLELYRESSRVFEGLEIRSVILVVIVLPSDNIQAARFLWGGG